MVLRLAGPFVPRHRRIRGVTLIRLTDCNAERCRTPEGAAVSNAKGEAEVPNNLAAAALFRCDVLSQFRSSSGHSP